MPYNYWNEEQWRAAFAKIGLEVEDWITNVGLYPAPASWFFDRSLHFIAKLKASDGVE